MPENINHSQEGSVNSLERFIKTQCVDVQDVLGMDQKEAEKYSREIVNTLKRPGSLEAKALREAISEVETKYNLAHGVIQAWAESYIAHQEEGGVLTEADYYSKPKDARAREMLMILENAKMACTPAEFEEYKKMMAPIIMKYKDFMPAEYLVSAKSCLVKSADNPNGFSEADFAAIDSQNPKHILDLTLGDHRKECAEHIADWFTIDWPRYTKNEDIANCLKDFARFVTNKYALEFNMYNLLKVTFDKEFKVPFKEAVSLAKNSSDDPKLKITDSLTEVFKKYHDKHFSS